MVALRALRLGDRTVRDDHAAADRDRRPGRRHARRGSHRRRGHGRFFAVAGPRGRSGPYHRLRLHQGPALAAAHGLADRAAEAGAAGVVGARDDAHRQAAGDVPPEADADGDRVGRVRRHRGAGDAGRRAGGTGGRDPRRAPPGAAAADRRPRRASWLVDASVNVDDFFARRPGRPAAPVGPREFSSMGGLIIHQLGRIPRTGDRVQWKGLTWKWSTWTGRGWTGCW